MRPLISIFSWQSIKFCCAVCFNIKILHLLWKCTAGAQQKSNHVCNYCCVMLLVKVLEALKSIYHVIWGLIVPQLVPRVKPRLPDAMLHSFPSNPLVRPGWFGERQEQRSACFAASHTVVTSERSCFFMLFSVRRISAAPLQYYSFESALVFVLSVYTDARSVDRRTVHPHHCASTEQLKDCSYLRNSFNTLYEWPISLLKPCYIALQLMSEHACIPPSSPFACVSHTYILVHSIHFSLSYISANKYADTHVHPLPDYCSLSGKRCA